MKFYLFYADTQHAKKKNFPRACSAVELNTIEDVIALKDKLGYALVFGRDHMTDQELLESYKEDDEEDYQYLVDPLPNDIETTPSIIVYNGYLD